MKRPKSYAWPYLLILGLEDNEMDKEAFISMAKGFGLDIKDPHMEELYAYVQKILPILKRIEELDLTDLEPVMPLISSKKE